MLKLKEIYLAHHWQAQRTRQLHFHSACCWVSLAHSVQQIGVFRMFEKSETWKYTAEKPFDVWILNQTPWRQFPALKMHLIQQNVFGHNWCIFYLLRDMGNSFFRRSCMLKKAIPRSATALLWVVDGCEQTSELTISPFCNDIWSLNWPVLFSIFSGCRSFWPIRG